MDLDSIRQIALGDVEEVGNDNCQHFRHSSWVVVDTYVCDFEIHQNRRNEEAAIPAEKDAHCFG